MGTPCAVGTIASISGCKQRSQRWCTSTKRRAARPSSRCRSPSVNNSQTVEIHSASVVGESSCSPGTACNARIAAGAATQALRARKVTTARDLDGGFEVGFRPVFQPEGQLAWLLSPFTVAGRNSLLAYVFPILLKLWILAVWQVNWTGKSQSILGALLTLAQRGLGVQAGGWVYSLGYVAAFWLGLWVLARRGFIWKL